MTDAQLKNAFMAYANFGAGVANKKTGLSLVYIHLLSAQISLPQN